MIADNVVNFKIDVSANISCFPRCLEDILKTLGRFLKCYAKGVFKTSSARL